MFVSLIVKVEKVNDVLVTTSNKVAEELGVRHGDLLEKIDGYVSKFSSTENSVQFYIPSEYKSRDGRKIRNYLITKKGIAQVIGGYSGAVKKAFDLNVAYINEFERMENIINKQNQIGERERLLLGLFSKDNLVVAESYNKLIELETTPLKEKIETDRPKVELVDNILEEKKYFDAKELAKMLNIKGFGRNNLLKYLRDKKVLNWRNEPYQKYVEDKYAKLIVVKTGMGVKTKPVFSVKMLNLLTKKLKNENK